MNSGEYYLSPFTMPDFHSLKDSYRRYALYEKGHRPMTVRHATQVISSLCSFACETEIASLSTSMIREFLQTQREQRGWTAKTFRIYRQHLKTFFDWSVSQEWIDKNPVLPIKCPRLPKPLPRCLTKEQAILFLSHVTLYRWRYELESSRNKAIVFTFQYSGMRLSELLNLWSLDVDLSNEEITIRNGKNEKDRLIAINPSLLPVLKDYQKARMELGIPSMFFFPSVKSDKKLTVGNLYDIFRKLSRACGFKVTPHMLRHTFGRLSVESGQNLRVTQEMLGHGNIRTTEIYTHVSIEAMKQSMRERPLF